MSKSMLEMQNDAFSFRNSRAGKKDAEFNGKLQKFFENQSYEKMIKDMETLDNRKKYINEGAKAGLGMNRHDRRVKTLKEALQFKEAVTNQLFQEGLNYVFYNAIPLDEDFKENYKEKLYKYCEDTVKKFMEKGDIPVNYLDESAEVIKDFHNFCEECGKDCSDEILKATKDSQDKKLLSEKEKSSDDDTALQENLDMKDTGITGSSSYVKVPDYIDGNFKLYLDDIMKDVSNVIKDKVVDVIRTEQDREQSSSDIADEIKEKVASETNTTPIPEEGKQSQTELDMKNGSINDTERDTNIPAKVIKPSDIGTDKITESVPVYSVLRRKGEPKQSLFRTIMVNTGVTYFQEMTNLIKESVEESPERIQTVDMDMDLIFGESIIVYTMLETLNTTKIMVLDPFKAKSKVTEFMLSK